MTPNAAVASFPAWWQVASADPASAGDLWDELKSALDIKQYVPVRAAGILSTELTDKSGHHFMLKNGATHSYARLSPEEFWIWERMDGVTNVQGLVLAYFMQYKAFAFDAILSLVDRLREGYMLAEPPRHLYADVASGIGEESLSYKLSWPARFVFTKEFVIKNLDRHMDAIHRYGGWILFTLPVQILFLLVSVIGTWLFIQLAQDPYYNLLSADVFLQLGLLAYIPLVIHEFGHAITAKHMGCEVYKGGVMLYYGLPAAFIDTTDVWFFGKRARLAVTWAGPYTGYIIGGACSIMVYLYRHLPLQAAVILLQIAFVGIFTSTLNLLPLLKLDGYYLLADALEIPRLRERSMDFILHGLRLKLLQRERWTGEQAIFLVFGILAFLSTFYFTYAGGVFWDSQASTSLAELLNFKGDLGATLLDLGIAILAASSIYLSFSLILDGLKNLYAQLQRRGYLSTPRRAALIILILTLSLTFLPRLLLPTLADWFLVFSGIGVFAFASWLSFSNFLSMRGSIHIWIWLPLSLAALFGAAGFIDGVNIGWTELALLARAAALLLFLISMFSAGRLLFGLRGSWRAVSLAFLYIGIVLLAVSTFVRNYVELNTLSGLLILAGLVHWRMRPITPTQAGERKAGGSTREQMMNAYDEIRSSVLSELELDFGALSRERVESGAYRPHRASMGQGRFSRTMTGMTPNDYGGALALQLDELLESVERLGGKKYAWRALAYGYDKLDWELQEIAEDYLLKYVPYASGLSNKLSEQRDDLGLLLRSVPLFMDMPETMIHELRGRFKVCNFSTGDEIVRSGDAGDSFYVVRAGRLEVVGTVDFASDVYKPMNSIIKDDHVMFFSTKPRKITRLTRGDYFGELALLEGRPRAATVRAVTAAEVLKLSKADFDRLLRDNISFDENAREEIRRQGLLRQIPLFEGFDGGALKSLVRRLEEVKVRAGDSVFRQGEPADKLYIIELGKAGVIIDGEQHATLGTGEYFGEIALLMKTPRTATVTALQPLSLLQLRAEDFNELLQDSSDMKHALERASSRRMLANERRARQRQLTGRINP